MLALRERRATAGLLPYRITEAYAPPCPPAWRQIADELGEPELSDLPLLVLEVRACAWQQGAAGRLHVDWCRPSLPCLL